MFKRMARHEQELNKAEAFLTNEAKVVASIDFFTVPTATFRALYVFVVLIHERRRDVHFNVTENPSETWTTQQTIEAFPWDTAVNETGTPSLKDFKKAIRTWNLLTGFLETEIPLTTDLRTFSVNPETNLLAIFDTARIAILNTESLHPIQVLATPGRLVTTLEFADERLIFMLEAIMQNSLDLILSQAKKINISIASRALFLELYYLLMNHKWLRAAKSICA
jgi:hypothetical protein